MKRLTALFLILALCVTCAACGGNAPATPTNDSVSNNAVASENASTEPNIQFPSSDVQLAIDTLSSMQNQLDDAASACSDILGSQTRGWQLERVTEYYVNTPQNYTAHGLLFQIKGDVAFDGMLYDRIQIGLDLTGGEVIINGTEAFNSWMDGFSGEFTCGRDILMCCISAFYVYEDGGQFYFPNEKTYSFSQDMLDRINTDLGWTYTPYPQDVPTEEITSTPEERITLVTDAVRLFLSQRGDAMMEDFASLTGQEKGTATVSHAMEYRLGSMDGYPVHGLLINLQGNFAFEQSSNDHLQIFYDLQTGEVYDSFMLNNDFYEGFEGICRSEEDVPLFLIALYYNVVSGSENFMVRDSEKSAVLDADALAQVNSALTE